MKVKTMITSLCAVAFVAMSAFAVNEAVQVQAETPIDISANVAVTDVSKEAELNVVTVFFGDNVFDSGLNYGAMDDAKYQYIQEYLTIDGKTVKEINTDTSLNAISWNYTVFPSTANDIYKVPVIIYESSSKQLKMKVHDNYWETLGAEVEIGVKAGMEIVNGSTTYVVATQKTFTVEGSKTVTVDVTDSVVIDGWKSTGDARELMYTRVSFGAGVIPTGVDYKIVDGDWKYMLDYLMINGKTIRQINESTDVSKYVFSTFPSTAGEKYQVPVIIFVNGDWMEIKIHNDYIAAIGGEVKLTVKAGAYFINGDTKSVVSRDVEKWLVSQTYTVTFMDGETVVAVVPYQSGATSIEEPAVPTKEGYKSAWEAYELTRGDIIVNAVHTQLGTTNLANGINVENWIHPNEYYFVYVTFPAGSLPTDIGYHAIDSDIGTQYHYIQEYITINGKTVKEINETTDVSSYVFESFPASVSATYQVPVLLYGKNNGDTIELMFHKDYVATLGNFVEVTIKQGLAFYEGDTRYLVEKDVTRIKAGEVWYKEVADVTQDVTISGWKETGDTMELQYTNISFGMDIFPTDIDYGVISSAEYQYLQEYITINGKTVKEINETTDVSSYVFKTFPSRPEDNMPLYQIPVVIFVNGDKMQVKIHKQYLVEMGGNVDVVIGVKEGAYIANSVTGKIYQVTQDVQATVKYRTYTLSIQIGNAEDEQYLVAGGEIVLQTPSREGYLFEGWFVVGTNEAAATQMPAEDYAIYAKLTPIEYTVTFKAGETVVDTVKYTVENTEIVAPAVPEKEGYTGAWEAYELTYGDVVVQAVYTEIPVAEQGCGGVIGGASLLGVCLAAAFLLKKKEND